MSTEPDAPVDAPEGDSPAVRRERQLAGLSVTVGIVGIGVVATLFLGLAIWL